MEQNTNTTTQQQPARPANAIDKQTEAQIVEVYYAEPLSKAADPNTAVDICLALKDKDGETHTWRSEYSGAYGTGNNASRTRAQITVDALASIGWSNGHDLSNIGNLLTGKVIPIAVKWTYHEARGQWYKNVYLGHGGPRRIDPAVALNIIRNIAGAGAGNNAQSATTQQQPAQNSPFSQDPFGTSKSPWGR